MIKAPLAVAMLGVAVTVLAIETGPSDSQTGVQGYRYCSLDHNGGTVGYFNDRVACAKAGSGRCIDNPLYSSGYAAARDPGGSARKHRHP